MSLLQGAFSHHGFARDFEPGKNGFFRQVIDNKTVRGPVVITKTANDKAVGFAYAVASRISNDAAAGVGDAGDKFGGIGRNGAVKTTEAIDGELQAVGDHTHSSRGPCTTCWPTSSSPITPRSRASKSLTQCFLRSPAPEGAPSAGVVTRCSLD